MSEKNQRSNVMLAFFTLVAVIILVSVIGFFTLGKGPEIIQGQAEATEYRVSSKVPGRILKYWVYEGDKVRAGDTLAILEAPEVMAKLSQAQAAEQAALALSQKAEKEYVPNSCRLLMKCGRKPKPDWRLLKNLISG